MYRKIKLVQENIVLVEKVDEQTLSSKSSEDETFRKPLKKKIETQKFIQVTYRKKKQAEIVENSFAVC